MDNYFGSREGSPDRSDGSQDDQQPLRWNKAIFRRRPELADVADSSSTAEEAANSPRYRRRSSTFLDGVHDLPTEQSHMAPAQLYSTMSGRLFHSGRIAIVLVGPPARGKT